MVRSGDRAVRRVCKESLHLGETNVGRLTGPLCAGQRAELTGGASPRKESAVIGSSNRLLKSRLSALVGRRASRGGSDEPRRGSTARPARSLLLRRSGSAVRMISNAILGATGSCAESIAEESERGRAQARCLKPVKTESDSDGLQIAGQTETARSVRSLPDNLQPPATLAESESSEALEPPEPDEGAAAFGASSQRTERSDIHSSEYIAHQTAITR